MDKQETYITINDISDMLIKYDVGVVHTTYSLFERRTIVDNAELDIKTVNDIPFQWFTNDAQAEIESALFWEIKDRLQEIHEYDYCDVSAEKY